MFPYFLLVFMLHESHSYKRKGKPEKQKTQKKQHKIFHKFRKQKHKKKL